MKFYYYTIIFFSLFISACGNEQLPLPRLAGDAVILAFGDSLTYGTGANSTESYPAVLEKLTGRKVINAGISGEESQEGLMRLPDLLETHQPDLLILCHGGNDILRKKDLNRMSANIREMIGLAREQNIPVVMIGVPRFGIFLSSLPQYREIADSTDVVFIEDLIPDILSDAALKSDTVHPNKDGYQKMAEQIHAVLQDSGAI